MGQCFFLPDDNGGNEKYIKAKKVHCGSEIISNFAAEIRNRRKEKHEKKENTMKFTTLLTIIITGYVIYYAYQIIHDLFFNKGSLLSDELRIEEEVDITGEVEKYQPVKVTRESIPLAKESNKEPSQDDGLTQMCGGYTIDELHNALRQEHDNPGSTPLKDVMKLYE